MRAVAEQYGERFPEWVLDQLGTEVMLANQVAMGPGLAPTRFRWVSFVDALMLPLSTRAEAAVTPDRQDFADIPAETARAVYVRYARGGEPPRAEYKALQDFLFREVAREAGHLGMAVHLHSFEGPGAFYETAGADPLLLEPVFNDPSLRHTSFVLVHGGGVYAAHARAMMWKPNVYVDTSAMALIYTPETLAAILRDWLLQFPERVLFGTDAASFGWGDDLHPHADG